MNGDGDAADDPKVDVPDPVRGQHQQVGGVKVTVEGPFGVHLAEEVPDDVGRDLVEVVAGIAQTPGAALATGPQLADDVEEQRPSRRSAVSTRRA